MPEKGKRRPARLNKIENGSNIFQSAQSHEICRSWSRNKRTFIIVCRCTYVCMYALVDEASQATLKTKNIVVCAVTYVLYSTYLSMKLRCYSGET